MGTFNGNTEGGRFAASRRTGKRKQSGAGWQILFSLLLLIDLFMLYTMIMQITNQQKVFELDNVQIRSAVNYGLLAFFTLGAILLIWAVIRTGAWKRFLCLFLIFAILWLAVVFSDLPLIKKYRDMWISTAWSTMRHRGLATFYFPASVVNERVQVEKDASSAMVGVNTEDVFEHDADDHSDWMDPEKVHGLAEQDEEFEELNPEQKEFYSLFYELDRESAEAYFKEHPETLSNGYEHILIDEAGLSSNGTSIRTKLGEKVLAIDMDNEILIVEVDCAGSRGAMAIAKRPSRLSLCAANTLPYYGQVTGTIAKNNGGILAMTGSGFIDEGGVGNGGEIAGWAMCGGKTYGEHYGWGYKRLELHENNWLYVTDAFAPVGAETTDAMEFQPSLVVNGKKQDVGIWTSQNPRACIGQSERGEILMLCVEGRRVDSPGCSLEICADVLLRHDCITALNCDGGTTAMMWYRGGPVIRCSNSAIPQGRYLPNAWVYEGD